MPKKPTDTLDGLRIEMNEKERKLAESYIRTQQMKIILPQLIDILTDPKKLYILGVLYELITKKDLPFIISGLEDAQEAWATIKTGIETEVRTAAAENAPGVAGVVSDYAQLGSIGPWGIFNFLIPDFISQPLGDPQEFYDKFVNREQEEQIV